MSDIDEGFPSSKRIIIDEPSTREVIAAPLPPGIPETLAQLNDAVRTAARRAGVQPKTVVFDAGLPDSPLPSADVYLNSQTAITPKLMEMLTPQELTAVTVFDAIYNSVLYKHGGRPEDLLNKNELGITNIEALGMLVSGGGKIAAVMCGLNSLALLESPGPTKAAQMDRRQAAKIFVGIAGASALAATGAGHLTDKAINRREAANQREWEPLHRQAQLEALKCCDEQALRSANAKMEAWAKKHNTLLNNWVSDIQSSIALKDGPSMRAM